METLEQAPWVDYLIIDENSGERKLADDAPEEIKNKYHEYTCELERKKKNNESISK